MEAAAAKLMDFSQPMDVALLDQVVTTAFDASHPQVNAQRLGGGGGAVLCCASGESEGESRKRIQLHNKCPKSKYSGTRLDIVRIDIQGNNRRQHTIFSLSVCWCVTAFQQPA